MNNDACQFLEGMGLDSLYPFWVTEGHEIREWMMRVGYMGKLFLIIEWACLLLSLACTCRLYIRVWLWST